MWENSNKMLNRLAISAAILTLATLWPGPAAVAGDPRVEPVRNELLEARAQHGLPRLERRPVLDRVARERAEAIAARPHAGRLAYEVPMVEALRQAGARYLQMRHYMNMVKGYRHPGAALARQWKTQPSWRHVSDPEMDAYGLAAASSADGWIILIAVFVDDGVPFDGPSMEREVVAGINAVRAEHGLRPLVAQKKLARVARAHSADMALRHYMEHRNPEGRDAADRLAVARIGFRSMAENLHMSRGQRDPVAVAVSGWMKSPGHRAAILTADFAYTGVGAARGDDGELYFTQLFLLP